MFIALAILVTLSVAALVKVHILLDWLGSRGMDASLLAATRSAGCDLQLYHELSWYHLGRLNNRTHRKLLVVDGRIGFTGRRDKRATGKLTTDRARSQMRNSSEAP